MGLPLRVYTPFPYESHMVLVVAHLVHSTLALPHETQSGIMASMAHVCLYALVPALSPPSAGHWLPQALHWYQSRARCR